MPPGQEGVDQVLDQLFIYGTASLDRLAFRKRWMKLPRRSPRGTFFPQGLEEHFDRGVKLFGGQPAPSGSA